MGITCAEHVNGQERLAVVGSIARKRLDQQQPPALKAGVLDCRYTLSDYSPDLHN